MSTLDTQVTPAYDNFSPASYWNRIFSRLGIKWKLTDNIKLFIWMLFVCKGICEVYVDGEGFGNVIVKTVTVCHLQELRCEMALP